MQATLLEQTDAANILPFVPHSITWLILNVKLKKGINNDKKDSSIFSIGVMSQCEDKC
jgi:hypothetical protein